MDRAPQITSLSLSSAALDLSDPTARQLALTLGFTDDLSGLDFGSVTFRSPSGNRSVSVSLLASGLLSGSLFNGRVTGTLSLDNNAENGLWTLSSIYLVDKAGNGNYISANFNDIVPGLASLSFQVLNSIQDVAPPQLSSASLSATVVNVGSAVAAPLILELRFSDDLSGFAYGSVGFLSPSGSQSKFFSLDGFGLRSGSLLSGVLTSSISLDRNAEAGLWTLGSIDLVDQAGNRRTVSSNFNALLPGLDSLSFQVLNSNPDLSAPQITSATLSATTRDLTDPAARQISLDLGFSDSLSGLRFGSVSFRSPSGLQRKFVSLNSSGLRSGSLNNGVVNGTINLDATSEAGLWSLDSVYLVDNAGNASSSYSNFNQLLPGLASLGFRLLAPTTSPPPAQPDTSAPSLTSVALQSSVLDLRQSGSDNVLLTLGVSDDASGYDSGFFDFVSPSGLYLTLPIRNYLSGSLRDGSFFGSAQLGPYAEAGSWVLRSAYLRDASGNAKDGNAFDGSLNALFPGLADLSFQVINPLSDAASPLLQRAVLNANLIDLAQPGAANLVLTTDVTDNLSGFDYGYYVFASPSGRQTISLYVDTPITGNSLSGTFFGSAQLGRFAEAGSWQLQSVYLRDLAGNDREATAVSGSLELLLPGLSTLSFQVINPLADAIAPTLTSASLNTTTVDFGQPGAGPVGLTIGIADDLSGFLNGSFDFLSPSGNQTFSIYVDKYLAGTSLTGTFFGSSPLDATAEAGTWILGTAALRDASGNLAVGSRFDGSLSSLLPALNTLSFSVVRPDLNLPIITLDVQPASVLEDGGSNLIIRFTRTGSTAANLDVAYSLGGLATSSDYTGATPSSNQLITIPAGSASATLTLDPTADTEVEPDESVILNLLPSSLYTLGSPTAVSATIRDDDITAVLTTVGSVVFRKNLTNLRYSVAINNGQGTPITIQGAPIYEGIYPSWQTLSAATINGVNTVLWLNTQYNRLHTWTADANWGWLSSQGWIDPDSSEGYTLESQFQLDLNQDGGIGSPFSPLTQVGSVAFARNLITDRYGVVVNGVITPITIQGQTIYRDIYPQWQTLSAATINGVNTLLWRNSQYNRLHTWSLDANWSWLSSQGWIDPDSSEGYKLESLFQLDLNQDAFIGTPYSTISSVGTLLFQKNRFNHRYAISTPDGVIAPITIQGQVIYQGIYPQWETLAAASVNGVNTLLWRNIEANRLHTWSLDANWSWLSSQGWIDPFSVEGSRLEEQFQLDINQDSVIGTRYRSLGQIGAVQFQKAMDSNQFSVLMDGVITPITIQGQTIYEGIYPSWQTLGAANVNGVNTVLWRNIDANRLHTWSLDANWRWLSSQGWIDPDSSDGYALESQFQLDLNQDGISGNPYLPVVRVRSVRFERNVSNGRYAAGIEGVTTPITIQGQIIYEGIYPSWQTLAAAQFNGVNTVLWRNTEFNRLHTWSLDANWNWLSSQGWIDPSSPEGHLLEAQFSWDLNGDSIIGAPLAPLANLRSRISLADPAAVGASGLVNPTPGTSGADTIFATTANQLLSGYDLLTGVATQAGMVDVLDGAQQQAATFLVASPSHQPYAEDGDQGFTLIRNFRLGSHDLVLDATQAYVFAPRSVQALGTTVSGLGVHTDANGDGQLDASDNLIALLEYGVGGSAAGGNISPGTASFTGRLVFI